MSQPSTNPPAVETAKLIGKLIGFVLAVFALWELKPRWGYFPLAVLGFGLLAFWIVEDWERCKRVLRGFRLGLSHVWRTRGEWRLAAFAIAILLFCLICAIAGFLPNHLGKKNYVFEHQSLKLLKPTLAIQKHPATSTAAKSTRTAEQQDMNQWRHWMAKGIPGQDLVYLESAIPFDDEYGNFSATLKIDSQYNILKAVPFLQYDEPAFDNDPDYRPQLRQMDHNILNGANVLKVFVAKPKKGEKLILYVQVKQKDGKQLRLNDCFINETMGVSDD